MPVQVDQVMPYALPTDAATSAIYSGTDQELTYAWGPTRTPSGEEAWKKVAGTCSARYAAHPSLRSQALIKAGVITLGPQETPADYTQVDAGPGAAARQR